MIGALVRPLGGWLADRIGGAKVTFWNFVVMLLATLLAIASLPAGAGDGGMALFFVAFLLLFATAGIGNGSVFVIIPHVFMTLHQQRAEDQDEEARQQAIADGEIEGSVALGFTAAIAALGLFFIPALVAVSIEVLGVPRPALMVFAVFYATCVIITWWWYLRKGSRIRIAWNANRNGDEELPQ